MHRAQRQRTDSRKEERSHSAGAGSYRRPLRNGQAGCEIRREGECKRQNYKCKKMRKESEAPDIPASSLLFEFCLLNFEFIPPLPQ
jgi:hypothetical protein